MKDEERILANTLVTYGAKIVGGAIGFLMVPFLLHSLGEATYGVMGVCWSILGFLLLIEMGIRPAVDRQFTDALFREEIERSNEIASTSFAFYVLIATGIVATLIVGGDHFLAGLNVAPELQREAYWTLVMVGISSGLGLSGVPFTAALFSQLRHDIPHYVAVAKSVSTATLIVALFTLGEPRLLTWALVDAVASAAIFATYVRQAKRVCPTLEVAPRHVTRRGFGAVASFGMYTSLIAGAAWINMQSGSLVISYFLGTAAVAHFTPVLAVTNTLTPLRMAFLAPLRSFITKAQAQGDWAVIGRVLIRSTRYSLLSTGAISVGLACLAGPFIGAWLGEGFEDTALVLLLWSVGSIFQSSTGAAYGIYVGTARLRALAIVNTAIATISVVLGVYLVGFGGAGVAGVAWGMLAAQTVRSTAFFFYSTRICAVGYLEYLRGGFLGPVLCIAALGATALAVQWWIGEAHLLIQLAAAATASSIVYGLLVWPVGLDADDRRRAGQYLGKARTRLTRSRERAV